MPDIKLAVIGCGYWGENLVRSFHSLGSLYAICDADGGRLKSFIEKYPKAMSYASIERLLKEPKIDAVVIATPATTHYAIAKSALSRDKDVFVEKPMAMNPREAEELVALAHEKQRILMVGHLLEYHPAMTKLKDMIGKGELGKIYYIHSSRLKLGKFRKEEGVHLSFASHDMSIILSLLGETPCEVEAQRASFLTPNVDDITVMTMSFPGGAKAHIFASWFHPYKQQRLVVIGSKAMAVFDDMAEHKLILQPCEIKRKEGQDMVVKKSGDGVIKLEDAEPLTLECAHFIECIRTRARPMTDGESGLKVLRALEEALN